MQKEMTAPLATVKRSAPTLGKARGVLGTWPGRILVLLIVAALVGGVSLVRAATAPPAAAPLRTAPVTRGGVTQTVAVSGSVNAAAQVKLNFQNAGTLSQVLVSVGQQVTAGQPLARLDASNLQIAVSQAQASLASSQANYSQVVAGADSNDVIGARMSIDNSQQSLIQLTASYTAAKTNFSNITNAISADETSFESRINAAKPLASGAIRNIQASSRQTADVLSARDSATNADAAIGQAQLQLTQLNTAYTEYILQRDSLLAAIAAFDRNSTGSAAAGASANYQTTLVSFNAAGSRLTDALSVVTGHLTTATTNTKTAQGLLNGAAVQNYSDLDPARSDLSNLLVALTSAQQSATSINARISQTSGSISTITSYVTGGYTSAQNSLDSAKLALQKLTAAPKESSIASAYASLLNAQVQLDNARNNLTNATLLAPSSGLVAQINSQVGEQVQGGGASTSTTTGTATGAFILLANTSTVVLRGTIGEGDVAKLKLGQVATVTVDAVGSAKMTGKLTSIDPLATLQQGVPVYGVDVTIDVQNLNVKPGMSGTANVIIESHQGVLTVPNLAVRSAGGRRFVQILENGQAVEAEVTFGLSNDTVTEVTSGLKETDVVVLPAPRAAASGTTQQRPAGGGGGPVIVGR